MICFASAIRRQSSRKSPVVLLSSSGPISLRHRDSAVFGTTILWMVTSRVCPYRTARAISWDSFAIDEPASTRMTWLPGASCKGWGRVVVVWWWWGTHRRCRQKHAVSVPGWPSHANVTQASMCGRVVALGARRHVSTGSSNGVHAMVQALACRLQRSPAKRLTPS